MELLRFLKPKKEEFLVLDFGQSSVKGLVLEKNQEEKIIQKFDLQEIERFGVFDGNEFELGIVKRAANKVIKNLGVDDKSLKIKTIVGLPPDVFKAKVMDIVFVRQRESEKIGKEEEEQIYQEVLRKTEEALCGDWQIVKTKILGIKVSGYKIPSLLGFRGKNLVFKMLIIFGAKKAFDFTKELVESLGLKEVALFHEVEGLIALRGRFVPSVCLDIGHNATQFFCLEDDLQLADDFALGGYDFSKAISKDLGVSEREAETLKIKFSEGQFSKSTEEKFETIISPVFNQWLGYFQEKFQGKTDTYPQILIFGGGGPLKGLKEILKEKMSKGIEVDFLKVENLPIKNKTGIPLSLRAVPAVLLGLGFL